jgi:hypothetical protein
MLQCHEVTDKIAPFTVETYRGERTKVVLVPIEKVSENVPA